MPPDRAVTTSRRHVGDDVGAEVAHDRVHGDGTPPVVAFDEEAHVDLRGPAAPVAATGGPRHAFVVPGKATTGIEPV